MNADLDKLLCDKYPKMMVNRNKPMIETCMCWGFECGDGWYNILDQLMGHIQHHIDWKNKQRQWAIDFNSKAAPDKIRPVPDAVTQVTLDQVKEKFGTLSFYYTGGDDYIHGMVSLAEGISSVTCEECGHPGTVGGQGWIKTLCEKHRAAREERQLLKQGFEQ